MNLQNTPTLNALRSSQPKREKRLILITKVFKKKQIADLSRTLLQDVEFMINRCNAHNKM